MLAFERRRDDDGGRPDRQRIADETQLLRRRWRRIVVSGRACLGRLCHADLEAVLQRLGNGRVLGQRHIHEHEAATGGRQLSALGAAVQPQHLREAVAFKRAEHRAALGIERLDLVDADRLAAMLMSTSS